MWNTQNLVLKDSLGLGGSPVASRILCCWGLPAWMASLCPSNSRPSRRTALQSFAKLDFLARPLRCATWMPSWCPMQRRIASSPLFAMCGRRPKAQQSLTFHLQCFLRFVQVIYPFCRIFGLKPVGSYYIWHASGCQLTPGHFYAIALHLSTTGGDYLHVLDLPVPGPVRFGSKDERCEMNFNEFKGG